MGRAVRVAGFKVIPAETSSEGRGNCSERSGFSWWSSLGQVFNSRALGFRALGFGFRVLGFGA